MSKCFPGTAINHSILHQKDVFFYFFTKPFLVCSKLYSDPTFHVGSIVLAHVYIYVPFADDKL